MPLLLQGHFFVLCLSGPIKYTLSFLLYHRCGDFSIGSMELHNCSEEFLKWSLKLPQNNG